MKKLILLAVLLLSSCSTLSKWVFPCPIEKLSIGMTIEEVREVCRFPDKVVSTSNTQTWFYHDSILIFSNGELVEWVKLRVSPII